MAELTGQDVVQRQEHRFPVKVLLYAVWIASGLLFWHVGYALCAPVDPEASLSWASGGRILAGFVPVALLVGLTAGAATAVAGRWTVDAGVFAAAVGLSTLSVRGGTVEHLLLRRADAGSGAGGLAVSFAGEALAWIAVFAVAGWISGRVARVLGLTGQRGTSGASALMTMLDGFTALRERLPSSRSECVTGLTHAVVAGALAAALTIVFCVDLARRPVSHGQVIFVCSASAWLATYFTFKRFPVRTALYPAAGVAAACVVGYLIAMLSGGKADDLPPNLPSSPFLRALPMQSVAGAIGGALLGFWFAFDPGTFAARGGSEGAAAPSDGSKKARGRR